MDEILEKVRNFLTTRAQNYRTVFNPESLATTAVLKDLAKFCRAHESSYNTDARAHAVLEGRREVWLRIQRHLKLSDDELWKLHGKGETK